MAKTLVALYEYLDDAQDAVQDLLDNDLAREAISLVARTAEPRARAVAGEDDEGAFVLPAPDVALSGLRTILSGARTLAVSPIGTVVAAGPLATSLQGADRPDLAMSLLDMGLPQNESEWYAEGVRRGGALVALRAADEVADDAIEILEDYEPVDIRRRAEEWRASGWHPPVRP
jgi:hypothetical protein